MPSSSSRSRVPVRRSPRAGAAGRERRDRARASARRPCRSPPSSGCLLAAEVLLPRLAAVGRPTRRLDRFLVVPLLLAAAGGARRRCWCSAAGAGAGRSLAVAALLPLLALLVLVFLLGALGGGGAAVGRRPAAGRPAGDAGAGAAAAGARVVRARAGASLAGGTARRRGRPASVGTVSTGAAPMSSSWGPGWPVWSPPPSWPTPASG